MFSIIWEFIINILESSLFAIIANASFQKREYKNSILKQFVFLSFKSIFITILNIEIVSTIITIIAVLLLNCIFILVFFINTLFNSFFVSFIFSLALIVFCKHFLDKVAKHFWTLLQVQIGQSCKASTGSYPASRIAIADHI